MTELHPYPRFSLAERDRRWKAVRAAMAAENIDVIVVPNNTGHSMDFQANARYLSHVGGGGDADVAVVFPLEGEVTAIATSAAPRWPTVQDWTRDIREADRAYGRVAAERLKELKVENGPIGIAGLGAGTRSPEGTILHGFWLALKDAFPETPFVDATDIMRTVRYVKSQEEIDALRKSCEIIEKGIEAKIAAAVPGAVDWEVWGAALGAMMRHGSEIPVHQNWLSGANPVRTLTRPTFRVLERGDLIINELEANWMGYRSQIVQPVYVEVANPLHMELIKIQRELFNGLLEMFRPGVSVQEIIEATAKIGQKVIPKSGPGVGAVAKITMHGRGAGDDGPIIAGGKMTPENLAVELQENMVFIFKPSIDTTLENGEPTTCRFGDTILVTKSGGERLGTRPHDLAVSGE
jgi:Xaa-Pro aminopeptidase